MVDFTKPIQTRDGTEAILLKTYDNNDTDYRHAVEFVDGDGDRLVAMVDDDGDSLDGGIEIVNTVSEAEETDSAPGKVALPNLLRVNVSHSKKGVGTVMKVRDHATKKMLVVFPNGNPDGVWCFDKYLARAA